MSETWLLVEVEDSTLDEKPLGGNKLRYLVSHRLALSPESRNPDEVLLRASAIGFDVSYTSMCYPGVADWLWRRMESRVFEAAKKDVGKEFGRWDVSIGPIAKLVRRRDEG